MIRQACGFLEEVFRPREYLACWRSRVEEDNEETESEVWLQFGIKAERGM